MALQHIESVITALVAKQKRLQKRATALRAELDETSAAILELQNLKTS